MCLATLIVICGLIFKLNVESIMALYLIVVCMYCVSCGINLPLVRPEDDKAFLNGMFTGGMIFYISFPLFCFVSALLFVPNGWYYMVIGLFAPWGTDTFAYFTGVALGKHKIVPHISPKKTWIGFIGGVAMSVLAAFVLYEVGILKFPLIHSLILALIMSVAGVYGDLYESQWKRVFGVKDSGNIIPGHGGLLDRFDSTLMAMPFGAIYLAIFDLL